MLEFSKRFGICLGIAAAFCLGACGDDDSSTDKGKTNSGSEVATCETSDDCKDVEGKPVCDPDKKECVAESEQGGESGNEQGGENGGENGGSEQKIECQSEETECSGACYNLKTDPEHCGDCNKICSSGEVCKDGNCELEQSDEPECQDTETPTCDEATNSIKKCVSGKYQLTECVEQTCDAGECKTPAECENDMQPFCEGKFVKSCKDGKYDLEDCKNKLCEDGKCSDKDVEGGCNEETDKPSCDENKVKSCKGGVWDYHDCALANMTCKANEEDGTVDCAAADVPTCDENTQPSCEGNSLKKCVNGKFELEACPGICENNACKSLAIEDLCPDDADKKVPGTCGCGIPDVDSNNDGTPDCKEVDVVGNATDLCPDDDNKMLPGICGCGIPDDINETTGNPYCLDAGDLCPDDKNKTVPGVCGCGFSDKISPYTNLPQCIGFNIVGNPVDLCPDDSNKLLPGTCGCGQSDELDNDKHIPKCVISEEDLCTSDANKTRPGVCGCGVEDNDENLTDSDGDTVPDCIDQCKDNPAKYVDDECGCDQIRVKVNASEEYCAIPINKVEDFIDLRDGKLAANKNYVLMKDINLYDYFESTSVNNWTGVKSFTGKFFSDGKTISLKNKDKVGTLKCASVPCGLFNTLSNARIENIKLEFNIESTGGNTGMVAGYANSTVFKDVELKGDVKGTSSNIGALTGYALSTSTLTGIKFEGSVSAKDCNYIGGLAGQINGVISNVEVKSNILGRSYIGGVAGTMSGTVSDIVVLEGAKVDCSGTQCGGVFGSHSGSATNIEAHVDVAANTNCSYGSTLTGGVVGTYSGGTHKNVKKYGTYVREANCNANHQQHGGMYGQVTAASLEDIHQYGEVTMKFNHSGGGIIGLANNVNLINVANHGKVECKSGDGNCQYFGGVIGSYHTFRDQWGNQTQKTFKWENVLNEGEVVSPGPLVGGVVGSIRIRGQQANTTMNNVINRGKVTGSTYVGGIFGNFGCSEKECLLEDFYNTGDVVGGSQVGGIIGTVDNNGVNWNYFHDCANSKHTSVLKLNKVFSSGHIGKSTTSYAGGLIGYLNTSFIAKKHIGGIYVEGAGGWNKFLITCKKSDGTDVKYNPPRVYEYYDNDLTFRITNAYVTGVVEGGSSVGGLVGYLTSYTRSADYSDKKYSYSTDGNCTLLEDPIPKVTVKQTHKFILANAFSAAEIKGTSTTGGIIGSYNYSNTQGESYNHIINNVYASSIMPAKMGHLYGNVPSNVKYINMYYWTKSGAADVTPSGTIASAVPFDFVSAIPHIAADDVDLINQLKSNIKSSNTDELNTTLSMEWVEKEHAITNKIKAKLPFLKIEPAELPWEKEEQQDDNSGQQSDPNGR